MPTRLDTTLRHVKDLWTGLLDLIYPPHCLVCGCLDDDYLCAKCMEDMDLIGEEHCYRCGMPGENYCADCREIRFEFETAYSAGAYEGALKKAIHALKYDFHISIAQPLGQIMVRCFPDAHLHGKVDIVIPVPIHRNRLLERGFNQSIELAKTLCTRTMLPLETDVLYKPKNTPHQANLPQDQRHINMEGAFAIRNRDRINGKRVLLVDDVFTTGSTLNAAAKVLKEAGARTIHTYTLARSL